ncbi:hypothetical protein AMTRI_Chr08g209150 [Amborella trichopoda]|uniref:Uncharacterized protein n=1 Tax=Amborella trichopoda TaxID=13333 RepID=W1PEA4_AMBTC|nr:hypothetical protein AMTR_s00007p00213180 [Amborella trichopoda]
MERIQKIFAEFCFLLLLIFQGSNARMLDGSFGSPNLAAMDPNHNWVMPISPENQVDQIDGGSAFTEFHVGQILNGHFGGLVLGFLPKGTPTPPSAPSKEHHSVTDEHQLGVGN